MLSLCRPTLYSSPAGAIIKRPENGIVVVDREICLGKDECGQCLEACPYDAPQFSVEGNAKMQKCDFCLSRLDEGKEPICVAACPMRAFGFGNIEELVKKYGNLRKVRGFAYSPRAEPSIVFKPRERIL